LILTRAAVVVRLSYHAVFLGSNGGVLDNDD